MTHIPGGVTAAKGFLAAGVHCGVKNNATGKKDLALIYSQQSCVAAATYTKNRVKAAPLYVTMEHLGDGAARAIVCNSGNANACAPMGREYAKRMCAAAAAGLGIQPGDVVVGSTGVIGQTINIAAIEQGIPGLCGALSAQGSYDAAHAIMTTDTVAKEAALRLEIGGKPVSIGAIAKGSGMIHPNMGTMLCFITTDCAIAQAPLQAALKRAVARTFNRVSVDGDTSTNDMCVILANGLAENPRIDGAGADYEAFSSALIALCTHMARAIARDGEGASRLVTCRVHHAVSEEIAERLAKTIVASPLVKTAMHGADANWGRILCAMGYSQAPFPPDSVEIGVGSAAGEVVLCRHGYGLDFDEAAAKRVLSQDEVVIDVNVNDGTAEAVAWGCDLTCEYVRINGDYRT